GDRLAIYVGWENGRGAAQFVRAEDGPFRIGRESRDDRDNAIVLTTGREKRILLSLRGNIGISGQHLSLAYGGGQWTVMDSASSNGTTSDAAGKAPLPSNTVLSLSDTLLPVPRTVGIELPAFSPAYLTAAQEGIIKANVSSIMDLEGREGGFRGAYMELADD